VAERDRDNDTIDLREGDLLRHELVTSVVITKMALASLRGQWDDFSAAERDHLLKMAEERCLHLEHIVRALLDPEEQVQRPSSS
jgi:hypothetical protein